MKMERQLFRCCSPFGILLLIITFGLMGSFTLSFLTQSLPWHTLQRVAAAPPSICATPTDISPLRTPSIDIPKTLADYIRNHREKKRCLEADANPPCVKIPPTLVWKRQASKNCCGVGDRLETILFAFAVAVLSDRVFVIDYDDMFTPFPLELTLTPAEIDWRPPRQWHPEALSNKERVTWRRGFQTYRGYGRNVTKPGSNLTETFNMFEDDLIQMMARPAVISLYTRIRARKIPRILRNPHMRRRYADLQMYNQDGNEHELIRKLLRTLFTPSQTILARAREVSPRAGQSFVAVHIRAGRDVRESSPRLGWSSQVSATEVAQTLLDKVMQGDVTHARHVFIASDSSDIKTEMMRLGRLRGFQMYAIMRPAMHISLGLHGTVSDADTCQAYLDVFTDLAMMSRAEVLLSTTSASSDPSRFSNAAFYLGKAVRMRVLYMDDRVGE